MDSSPRIAKRGRPASFDRAEAVQRAMELFWERGYEGVTLEDLLAAMGGIKPPSFYHAFGSKEDLFQEAVDLYASTFGAPIVRALQEGRTARESVDAMLRRTVESVSCPGKPRGCMFLRGAMTCARANQRPQEYVRAIRQRGPKVIKQRLDRAVADGDLSPDVDTAAVASFYATVAYGLGIRAGDGASRGALMTAVDGAMAAWDALIVKPLSRPRRRR